MSRKTKPVSFETAVKNNLPRADEYQGVVAIVPLEQGVFAWVIEDTSAKRRVTL